MASNVESISERADRLTKQLDEAEQRVEAFQLKTGGGGGTSDGMDAVDAKIAASEARTDTKFAELRGDLKDFAKKSTVWQAAATIIAVVLAAIAFGGDRFDAGMGVGDMKAAQVERDQKQDQAVQSIESKLDQIIAAQPKQAPAQPAQ